MDLRFSPEENAFRQEVRTFFQTEIPLSIRSKSIEGRHLAKEDIVTAQKTLHKKGWAVYNWPKEWGGTDWTPVQQYIFLEEMQSNGVPPPLAFNTSMNGPVIIQFGTDEQKKKFLPRMASLDDWWCQGFSEPGSGSDLASLTTTAVKKGDHYIVNGQKTWTTLAQYADWIFCLVRTDPNAKKQQGISYIVLGR
jgi:alkylation response protein AidB-like acyl-CoA dehydrogenase